MVAGEASTGEEPVALVPSLAPDVVLMDVRMPGMGGIEATRRIVATRPRTRVVVLTTFDLDEYAFAALQAGASAFLLKSAPAGRLVDAIRTVAERRRAERQRQRERQEKQQASASARSESAAPLHPGYRGAHDPALLRDGDDPNELIVVRSPRGRLFLFRRNDPGLH